MSLRGVLGRVLSVGLGVFVVIGAPVRGFASESCLPANTKITESKGVRTIKSKVVRTVDGDTIKAKIGTKEMSIRFLSIDTPETHYMGKSQGIWGDRAHEKLAELLPDGAAITIELDKEVCDRYSRLLGYVFRGKKNINRAMLESAMAVNYCIYPNVKYCQDFADVVQEQVEAREGIFGDSSLVTPYEWRRVVSDRPFEKFVGNIRTHEVMQPGPVERIPIADRIFFMQERDIKAPYFVSPNSN